MGASARVEAATRIFRPQEHCAAIRLVLRPLSSGRSVLAVAPQGHGVCESAELVGVPAGGGVG